MDAPGVLFLSQERRVEVRIRNMGVLGALVAIADLEEPVFEGERAVLEHPRYESGLLTDEIIRSSGCVVRVELDFEESGVERQLAVYFDGGSPPDGYMA